MIVLDFKSGAIFCIICAYVAFFCDFLFVFLSCYLFFLDFWFNGSICVLFKLICFFKIFFRSGGNFTRFFRFEFSFVIFAFEWLFRSTITRVNFFFFFGFLYLSKINQFFLFKDLLGGHQSPIRLTKPTAMRIVSIESCAEQDHTPMH